MDIKSTRYFRQRYLIDDRHYSLNDGHDIDFIGCEHQSDDGIYSKGFFELFHGDKGDIRNFIAQHLKNAEDGQAIYEFLQNAEDANSSEFMVFYNDKYFMVVNNGDAFRRNGIKALLNVAQSDKNDSSKIGRFGIGFKLVHRLVGEGEGLDELLRDYCGPIVYSWSREEDLVRLLDGEAITPLDVSDDESPLPYLFKILITNFPAGLEESILDLDYNRRVAFTGEEYLAVSSAARESLQPYIGKGVFGHGALFFIQLGKGKKEKLDDNFENELTTGVEYSLNTLSHIRKVVVNGKEIRKVDLHLEEGLIGKRTPEYEEINPEYKDADINYFIGYSIDFSSDTPLAEANKLMKSPTFYKYFPLGDETHSSALFVHCDAFSNQTNRRKLQNDNTNLALLPKIADFIGQTLSRYKNEKNWDLFRQLYASILLTGEAHDNSAWLNQPFFRRLPAFLKQSIPVFDDNSQITCVDNPENVKIKKIACNVPITLANPDYRWFIWDEDHCPELAAKMKVKVDLKSFSILGFLKEVNIDKLDTWIENASSKDYEAFLKELDQRLDESRNDYSEIVRKIKLFKFSDGRFYSYNDLVTTVSERRNSCLVHRLVYKEHQPIYIRNYLKGLGSVAESLGLVCSEKNVSDYPGISKCFSLPTCLHVFGIISALVETHDLPFLEKRKLFAVLTTDEFKEDGPKVDLGTLKLCRNNKGEKVALSELVRPDYGNICSLPEWIKPFQVKQEDYFVDLDHYMLAAEDLYREVVVGHWDEIKVTDAESVMDFYSEVLSLYVIDGSDGKPSLSGKKSIYTEDGAYEDADSVFYLSGLADERTIDYASLHESLSATFGLSLPRRDLYSLFGSEPFLIPDTKISDLGIEDDCEPLTIPQARAIIKTAKFGKESFFDTFCVYEDEDGICVGYADDDSPQAYTDKKEVRDFIETNCASDFTMLPAAFSEYSSESGILRNEELYSRLISVLEDVDSLKESLIDIIRYDGVKSAFLLKLERVTLDITKPLTENDFAVRVFRMATNSNILDSEEKRETFREKIDFKDGDTVIPFSSIPTSSSGNLNVEGALKSFDVAMLLPNEYGNGSLLKKATDELEKHGISKSDTSRLFGLTDTPDEEDIYERMKQSYSTLENAQQLAFVLLKENGTLDKSGFSVYDIREVARQGEFVVTYHSFIDFSYILNKRYKDLGQYISLPTKRQTFIRDCYIEEGKFIVNGLNTIVDEEEGSDSKEEIDFGKVTDLLDFLSGLHAKDKEAFDSVEWKTIKDDLGFDPTAALYPGKYAMESEKLPEAVEKWVGNDRSKMTFLSDMAVLTEESAVIRFRKYMTGETVTYSPTDIFSCDSLADIEHSLEWLNGKLRVPLQEEKAEALLDAVQQINKLRESVKKEQIYVTEEYDFDLLEETSTEYENEHYRSWSEETGFRIFLHNGPLPRITMIDEYLADYSLVKYNEGNIVCTDGDDPVIYINSRSDPQAELRILAQDNEIGLDESTVYKLFDADIAELRAQIAELKKSIELKQFGDAAMKADNPNDLGSRERAEYSIEAKEVVRERLEAEGFTFTSGLGRYSSIPGVLDPDGRPVKMIVKSAMGGTVFIHPNEWAELLSPGAQLWVYTHQGAYPIHIREMIRNQDRINLSINTSNLDTEKGVSKIATLMQWMQSIHFEFKSIVPSHIATDYREYAFDDRKEDEKPTADEFIV